MEDLTEYDAEGNRRSYFEVMKERLFMKDVSLRRDPKGFSYAELRSLIQMGDFPKVNSLPTIALKALRDKVLILLDADVDYHITKWTTLLNDIKRVAEYKNWQVE